MLWVLGIISGGWLIDIFIVICLCGFIFLLFSFVFSCCIPSHRALWGGYLMLLLCNVIHSLYLLLNKSIYLPYNSIEIILDRVVFTNCLYLVEQTYFNKEYITHHKMINNKEAYNLGLSIGL